MLHIVMLSDADRTVTDIVAFDDFKRAESVAADLSAKFGKDRVQCTSLTVNVLPEFWGLTNDGAVEHQMQPTVENAGEIGCKHIWVPSGISPDWQKCSECGHWMPIS